MQNHISCVDISYCLPDGAELFSSISQTLSAERTALIGPNGIGKTALLEMLAGLRAPSSGSITRSGHIELLKQSEDSRTEDQVADSLQVSGVLVALDRIEAGAGITSDFEKVEGFWDLPERIKIVFAQLGIEKIALQRPVDTLSGGELMRVRIARLLLKSPDFLLLDEPTNHLDMNARSFIYETVRQWTKGLVVVSHDRRLLSEVDSIAELSSTGLKMFGGNFEFYREQKAVEDAAAQAALEGARQRLKRATAMAVAARERQQQRQASGRHKKAKTGMPKMMAGNLRRRAETTSGKLSHRHDSKIEDAMTDVKLARGNVATDEHIRVDLHSSSVPSGRRIIELLEVKYRYTGSKDDLWPRPLNLLLTGPERLWLKGPNGSGKSTLIDLICERKHPSAGEIVIGTTRVGLLDQRVSVLDDNLTLLENIRRRAPERTVSDIRTLLGRFLFVQDAALKPVAGLSGGERIRAGLACLLAAGQAPELLILDEPANNLDLRTIGVVASAISDFRGAMIVVSHDVDFLKDIGMSRTFDLETL